MNQKERTIKQHYVPQIYLKNFSPNAEGLGVYRFDLKKGKASEKPVPVKSIAYQKNLYEIKDVSGKYVWGNYIENHLAQVEGCFADMSRRLLNDVRRNPNIKFIDLMSVEEVSFWLCYISIQLLRTPTTMEGFERMLKKHMDTNISAEEAHSHVLSNSFPFFSDSNPDDDTFFNRFTEYLGKMNFYVVIDPYCGFWTSDNPVCGVGMKVPQSGFKSVVFPLSPDVAFYFTPVQYAVMLPAHGCKVLTKPEVRWINAQIIYQASQAVFSCRQFSAEDNLLIQEVWNSNQTKEMRKKLRKSIG